MVICNYKQEIVTTILIWPVQKSFPEHGILDAKAGIVSGKGTLITLGAVSIIQKFIIHCEAGIKHNQDF